MNDRCPICGAILPSMRASDPLGWWGCERCGFEVEPAWGPPTCPHCGCDRRNVPWQLDKLGADVLCGCCHAVLATLTGRRS